MTLDLAFIADSEEEARAEAQKWAEHEPSVFSLRVVSVERWETDWIVRAVVTFRVTTAKTLWT